MRRLRRIFRATSGDVDPHEQLRDLCNVFESHGVRCWLDAGSLLGVVRSGALLPWDKDIDFGCWEEELPALMLAVECLRRSRYHVRWHEYRGLPYQVKLRPPLAALLRGMRTVDVAVFRRHGEYAWCPINCVQPPPARRFSLRWFLRKPLREWATRRWERKTDRAAVQTTFPKLQMDVRTWLVPVRFFADLRSVAVGGAMLRLPADAEEYLSLRYGNWREPRRSWNYCEDDGVTVPASPDEVLSSL